MMPIRWGIGNRAYLTLLMLIPFFNMIWVFICGAKGNEWAFDTSDYEDVDEFMASQESWNRIGFVLFIVSMVGFVLLIPVIIMMIGGGIAQFVDNVSTQHDLMIE